MQIIENNQVDIFNKFRCSFPIERVNNTSRQQGTLTNETVRVCAQHDKLENVSIANALQLEAARRGTLPIRFYTSPVSSLKSLSLSVAAFTVDTPRCAVTLNFDPVTLTFDL